MSGTSLVPGDSETLETSDDVADAKETYELSITPAEQVQFKYDRNISVATQVHVRLIFPVKLECKL